MFLTASIGIAFCPRDAENVIDLIRNADAAMYYSKQNGGNTFAFYSPEMNAAAVERLMLKSKLRRALERDELVIRYQPKVDLRNGRIIGAEALLRWRLPGHGDIPPSQFIPLAEETNLILDIGEWVLNRVCMDYRADAAAQVGDPGRISLNLSLKQLRQASFILRCRSVFRRHHVSPTAFELEITETTLMADPQRTVRLLDELYAMGLHLSIDDFGTGYSSLSALQQFPIGTLKIDQSFVRDVAEDAGDATIVRTIIEMGRSLGMEVIAEGVESRAPAGVPAQQPLPLRRRGGCSASRARPRSCWLLLTRQASGERAVRASAARRRRRPPRRGSRKRRPPSCEHRDRTSDASFLSAPGGRRHCRVRLLCERVKRLIGRLLERRDHGAHAVGGGGRRALRDEARQHLAPLAPADDAIEHHVHLGRGAAAGVVGLEAPHPDAQQVIGRERTVRILHRLPAARSAQRLERERLDELWHRASPAAAGVEVQAVVGLHENDARAVQARVSIRLRHADRRQRRRTRERRSRGRGGSRSRGRRGCAQQVGLLRPRSAVKKARASGHSERRACSRSTPDSLTAESPRRAAAARRAAASDSPAGCWTARGCPARRRAPRARSARSRAARRARSARTSWRFSATMRSS